jgi:hypothetical protein
MVVLAFLTDPPVVRRILDHLDLPSTAPKLALAHSADDTADLWPKDEADRRARIAPPRQGSDTRHLPPRAPP